jgi:hypothetical protein
LSTIGQQNHSYKGCVSKISDLTLLVQYDSRIPYWCHVTGVILLLLHQTNRTYYSGVASKETFSSEDYAMWSMLRAWSVSRRGRKQKSHALRKYFRIGRHGVWTFATVDGLTLCKHADTEIKRHTLIQPDKSPYDGDWVYWSTRRGTDIETSTRVAKLLKKHLW